MAMSDDVQWQAKWWHPSGFWTTGTFYARTREDVKEVIEANGGSRIEVYEGN